MADFLIAAPPFTSRSGGIMVLHQLCSALNRLNHRTGIVFITEGSQESQNFKFAFSSNPQLHDPEGEYYDYFSERSTSEVASFVSNAIAIYPDIIKGNPLGGKYFVSYVLGVPKFEISAPFVLSYSKLYVKQPDGYLFKPFLSPYLTDSGTSHWTSRTLSITYIGKGSEFLDCYPLPGTVLIERDWPKDKQQLGIILRNCKYFFSWDCLSATNLDAIMCGAVPILLHDLQIPRSQLDEGEVSPVIPMINPESIIDDIRSTPTNVGEIDLALLTRREKARQYEAAWSSNVELIVDLILKKMSPTVL